jgi:tetratricopeptide (TPR) repeat protein
VNRREGRAAATSSRAGSGGIDAASSAALFEAGLHHLRARRNLDALIYCKKALAIDPYSADALHLMGLISLETGHFDLAVEWIAGAIRQSPQARYLSSLGTAFQRQGRREEALKAFGKTVHSTPMMRCFGPVLVSFWMSCSARLTPCCSFGAPCGLTRVNWKRCAGALSCSTSLGEAKKRSLTSPCATSHKRLGRTRPRHRSRRVKPPGRSQASRPCLSLRPPRTRRQ